MLAKPRRIYEMSEVYIPYLSPITPGSLVTVVDTKSGLTANKNTIAEVQEVRYEFSAESAGRTPLGTNTCEIRLLGYVDYKESMVLLHQQEVLELPARTARRRTRSCRSTSSTTANTTTSHAASGASRAHMHQLADN